MSRLSRRKLLAGSAAGLAATLGAQQRRPSEWEPPNILLVLADGLGAWMCGCYGSKEFKTPNIDLLARLGTRFGNSYAATPVGGPSRATLYTGRMPWQHGLEDDLPPGQPAPGRLASETMVSDLLSKHGYRCGFAGRWGLGGDQRPGHGFQFTYTLLDEKHQNPAIARNGEPSTSQGYAAELITAAAGEFLDQHPAGERFFLTLSYPNPAPPYDGHPQKYYDLYADAAFDTIGYEAAASNAVLGGELLADPVTNLRKCAAGVTALDDQLAVLQSKLRARGLWSDTLIVFTSGSGTLLGRHGLWGGARASEPPNMFEEIVQVPLLWAWPGEIPVEALRPELVSHYDVFPGLLEAAKVEAPTEGNRCGRSPLSIAQGGLVRGEERWPVYLFGSYRDILMARDLRYKLILRAESAGQSELYDLNNDPQESRNQYDNVSFRVARDRVSEKAREWRQVYAS